MNAIDRDIVTLASKIAVAKTDSPWWADMQVLADLLEEVGCPYWAEHLRKWPAFWEFSYQHAIVCWIKRHADLILERGAEAILQSYLENHRLMASRKATQRRLRRKFLLKNGFDPSRIDAEEWIVDIEAYAGYSESQGGFFRRNPHAGHIYLHGGVRLFGAMLTYKVVEIRANGTRSRMEYNCRRREARRAAKAQEQSGFTAEEAAAISEESVRNRDPRWFDVPSMLSQEEIEAFDK